MRFAALYASYISVRGVASEWATHASPVLLRPRWAECTDLRTGRRRPGIRRDRSSPESRRIGESSL